MGDKSPKANQKHKAQQQAKAKGATQKKQQQPSAAKGGAEKEVGGRCQTAINLGSLGPSVRLTWRRRLAALRHGKAQCEPTEPTEGPTDFPRIRTL